MKRIWKPNFLLMLLWGIVLGPLPKALAQSSPSLDWPAFRQQVLDNHPLAQQARLQRDLAAAILLRARGGFDPKAYADLSAKEFADKNYYQYSEAGIKWATWAGLELKGAYNWASGEYLNPERKIPKTGQAVLGLQWSLGQGLFFDERRANLRQAQIGLQQGEAERDAALNDLLLDAAKAYWTWVAADNQLQVYTQALEQARFRQNGLRESVLQGDKPAIDTTESLLQVQTRLLDLNFAQLDVQNALLNLNSFLWQAGQPLAVPETPVKAPVLFQEQTSPVDMDPTDVLVERAGRQHPELRLYTAKLRSLEIERRLKNEKRKPQLDVNYNLLGEGWTFFPTATENGAGLLVNDIKWGLNFAYPLLNRKARGDWQLTAIKIAQTDQALLQKRREVEVKIRQYANEMSNFGQQLVLYRDFTANYRRLLDAEIEKFNQGESSVFLINTREQRWLDAQIKYLKLISEYRKSEAGLRWAAGTLLDF